MAQPQMRLSATVLNAPDPGALGDFYARLLGWPKETDEPDWVTVRPPDGGPGLSFQIEDLYVPPVWPATPGEQQMQLHLDIQVDDLAAGVAWALENGATEAGFQPQDHVRVMLDPAGHPFCLFTS